MSELPDLCSASYDITDHLPTEQQNLQHTQVSHRFPLSTHTLPVVSTNDINNQWKQRFIQAKQDQSTKSCIFIPYIIQEFFSTGILIKSNTNGQAEQATLIQPTIDLNILLNRLQKQFTAIYPGVIIRSENIVHIINPSQTDSSPIPLHSFETSNNTLTTTTISVHDKDYFHSMPLCAEKYLYSLMDHISVYLTDTVLVPSSREIQNDFRCLKERLKVEEFETTDVQKLIDSVSVNIERQNWKVALAFLEKISQEIIPLKLNELFRLVHKYDDQICLMKDEDVIVILGESKEDRSTVIHQLAQSKLSDSQSMTRIRIHSNRRSVVLYDSSAFEITNIPQVDIANAISLTKVLHNCKTVRFLILVSYDSIQNQLNTLKHVAKTLARMIPKINEYTKTFSYLYIGFPSNEQNKVYELLVQQKQTFSEINRENTDFMNLFLDLLQKTEKDAMIFNPTIDDSRELLEHLLKSSSITYPDEVLHFSLTERSKVELQKQMRIHYTNIRSAMNRADHDIVEFKFDQIKHFNNLFSQTYVEQVYHECEKYLTRHQSNEYQQAISFINHCLFDQSLLTNEHVQRIQTYIDRDKTLIEYLNQQIDILIRDLTQKDINQVFVQQTFDNIKFLSESFNHIDSNKYKNICNSFTVKLESIDKSFRNSVESNEFEKCAKDMTRISQAMTILSTHLDNRIIAKKYKQMQEYFLDYLNNSVGNMSSIFINEILDQNDIHRLEKCIRRLENARNTSNLHPHISKEIIETICESLLSKIESHFEEIVKKIHVGINNKISFSALEQFVKELDSIRTISIIQQKTNQSYSHILGSLIEYLYESIRYLEQLLKESMQRQETVSYHQLRTSLSNLNQTQWIDKYRPSAYSFAMHNLEQLLLEHIQQLKQSISKVSLDIDDSHHKIRFVQERLSEMNEMKCFPQLNQHLSDFQMYSNDLMKNICIVIKHSFNVETWKRQGCPIIDLNRAENAFHYFNSCMFEGDDLKEFIRDYSQHIENQMRDCFDKIKQCESISRKDLFERARVLSNHFQEICQVKNNYPLVLSCFTNPKIVEQWQRELSDDLIDLEIEIETLHLTQQLSNLNQKLLMIRALSKLDRYLDGEKYIDIYQKYKNVVFEQMNNIFDEISNAIQQSDFERVAFQILRLPLSDDIGQFFSMQIKRSLHVKLDDLMDKTKMEAIILTDNLQLEQIKSLEKNLKQIQKAKRFLSQYFHSHNELDICIEEIKQLIEIRLCRLLESIKALIAIYDFVEVERRLDSITIVSAVLKDYCSTIILDEIQILKEHHKNIVSKEIVEKYSEMDISEYFFHPPLYIFAKFEAVISFHPTYVKTFDKIKQIIFLKFRKELEQSRLEKSREKKMIHLRRFESAVKYLPETVRNALEIELKHCQDDIL